MSGYLEVKYPFKSNLGLNPFKSWKKQWCILRPSVSCSGGGSLAVYCSEAGAPAGTVDLPSGCIVKRAKSRTRPHAFAVFSLDAPSKPRILLAAQTLQDAQLWMDKIRDLLNGDKLRGSESLLKDSFPVTVIATELSRKCGFMTDCVLTLSAAGLVVSQPTTSLKIDWKHISDVLLTRENGDTNRTCVLSINSGFNNGNGDMKFCTPLAKELVNAVRQALSLQHKLLSRSDGDLSRNDDVGEARRTSWYSGPSEVSLDDNDLIMTKECGVDRPVWRGDTLAPLPHSDSAWSRSALSIVSVSSGVYEEIAEEPALPRERERERERERLEHTYESVECVYGTMPRAGRRCAPPLPPRSIKLGSSWGYKGAAGDGVTRHQSLGELGPLDPLGPLGPLGPLAPLDALPPGAKGPRHKPAFSVFRKRLKSDSRIASPKSEKEMKDVETKKKRFDFTPSRDIFKSFKVHRKMKNLKITGLTKAETKSCEFLDETDHVPANRCSKSVECIEKFDDFDVSLEINQTNVSALEMPEEIVEFIFGGKIRLNSNFDQESEYVPMSPIVPPAPIEQHYIVMSPKTNIA